MAPRNTVVKKRAEQVTIQEDAESDQEVLDPRAISKDMERNTHVRKTQKRNQLSTKYQQEMSSLDQQVVRVTGMAAKQLNAVRHDQQKRLHDLVLRRGEIEDQIVQHTQVLERAYEAANREMKAAAKGRLDDLRSDDNGDDEEFQGMDAGGGGVDGRKSVPGKEAVRKR